MMEISRWRGRFLRPHWSASVARQLSPLALVPLGMFYCQMRGFFGIGHWAKPMDSLGWATATLLPWSLAAIAFVRLGCGDRGTRRAGWAAAALGVLAYLASGTAALMIGATIENAFYTRIPAIAVALLAAVLFAQRGATSADVEKASVRSAIPLSPADIVFAMAAGNYVELHGNQRTAVWRQTMANAERILAPAGFVRVHRRYLVARTAIATVQRERRGPVEITLRDGRRLPVSERYAFNVR